MGASLPPDFSKRRSVEVLTAASRAAFHSYKAKLNLSKRALKSTNKIKM